MGAERRASAPHPGPIIKHDYLDALGIDVGAFALQVGVQAVRLQAMLEGRASIDVATAVRLARSLQIPAERIMQMQIRCDFAAVRSVAGSGSVPVLQPTSPQPFPSEFITGGLGRATDHARGDSSYFFQQSLEHKVTGDDYAGLHALWRGDRLRIYDPAGAILWVGPVLLDLDGRVLLPFVQAAEWQRWFAASHPADLAFGQEHAEFFERMRDS